MKIVKRLKRANKFGCHENLLADRMIVTQYNAFPDADRIVRLSQIGNSAHQLVLTTDDIEEIEEVLKLLKECV